MKWVGNLNYWPTVEYNRMKPGCGKNNAIQYYAYSWNSHTESIKSVNRQESQQKECFELNNIQTNQTFNLRVKQVDQYRNKRGMCICILRWVVCDIWEWYLGKSICHVLYMSLLLEYNPNQLWVNKHYNTAQKSYRSTMSGAFSPFWPKTNVDNKLLFCSNYCALYTIL